MDDKYGKPTRWVVGDKGDNGAEKRDLDVKAVFDFSGTGSLAFTALSGRHEYDNDTSDTDDYDVPYYRSYSNKSDSTFNL